VKFSSPKKRGHKATTRAGGRMRATCGMALVIFANVVWLTYCIASSCLSIIVAEQATEAFSPHHVTRLTTNFSLRRDESVVETLL